MQSLEEAGAHRGESVSLSRAPCLCLYVKYEAASVWVGGLCEQRGFGVDRELCRGLVAVDYRALCPSALNKRMSRIKRQCSMGLLSSRLRSPHQRSAGGSGAPVVMDKSIDSSVSAGAP